MKLSIDRPVTLFIDEFQDFFRINKSIYSEMQKIWDIYHTRAHINLVVCGSIFSMMEKIFKDKKEPLYNRQTRLMTVRPFDPEVLKEILSEYNPDYKADDLGGHVCYRSRDSRSSREVLRSSLATASLMSR